jgi:hypothetical protein
MKSRNLIQLVLTLALLCAVQLAFAKPPAVSFAGGDGSSMEKAIIIKGATDETGVHAEYEYLKQHFPRYQLGGQSLMNSKGHAYDVLEFTTADGKKKTLYFDITAFFGK